MSSKHLKQIQSRLKRKKITVSYDNIRAEVLDNFPNIDLENMSEAEVKNVSQSLLNKYQQIELNNREIVVTNHNQAEAVTDSESVILAPTVPTELTDNQVKQVEQLAPQEAIAIIQEIAEDDTSRNKQLAQQLLTQVDEKTDTMVALIAAMPDIEAEMLKRKLQKMQPKRVDYEGILDSHFRQSQDLTSHLQGLVREYGISL